jgi:hypothetical protein
VSVAVCDSVWRCGSEWQRPCVLCNACCRFSDSETPRNSHRLPLAALPRQSLLPSEVWQRLLPYLIGALFDRVAIGRCHSHSGAKFSLRQVGAGPGYSGGMCFQIPIAECKFSSRNNNGGHPLAVVWMSVVLVDSLLAQKRASLHQERLVRACMDGSTAAVRGWHCH